MVTSFLPSFLSLILRQRRVNEMGTQQLLLDVYNLKTLMLKVPSLGTWSPLRLPRVLMAIMFLFLLCVVVIFQLLNTHQIANNFKRLSRPPLLHA